MSKTTPTTPATEQTPSAPDPHAGHGGSYRVSADGKRALVSRTKDAPRRTVESTPPAKE